MSRVLLFVALACSCAWSAWMWWPIAFPAASAPSERWVYVQNKTPGVSYFFYRVQLRDGAVLHIEGTHYKWEVGAAFSVKDAGTNRIVWATNDERGLVVEREP